ncbi:MAG: DUF4037 domain-containing protein [Candidatus Lokiarchaeota archaeon]|nr:DUF4037 domain-containing protein [Candidatus Lokiarchaeota archaeon]
MDDYDKFLRAISFVKGMELSSCLFQQAVRPILDNVFPNLSYSAARLGYGSDVLGFDTTQSRDHHWGPRLTIFISEDSLDQKEAIEETLSNKLPQKILGYPTAFRDLDDSGGFMDPSQRGDLVHQVIITTVNKFFSDYIGLDPSEPVSVLDWLVIPQQRLATISRGKCFFDGLGVIEEIRKKLAWYPHDVWLYLLAGQWTRIAQEEPFLGRTGDVGDELGSRIIATRLVHDIMQLCYLMERKYIPYSKWFGTAFKELSSSVFLTPIFHEIFNSKKWKERQKHFVKILEYAADLHNQLGITKHLDPKTRLFHTRPYEVIGGERFAESLYEVISDETVRQLPRGLGSVDQMVKSIDVLENISRCRTLKKLLLDVK